MINKTYSKTDTETQKQMIINQMTQLDLLHRRPQIAITKIHGPISMDDVSYVWTSKSAEEQYNNLKQILASLQ